MKNNKLSRFK